MRVSVQVNVESLESLEDRPDSVAFSFQWEKDWSRPPAMLLRCLWKFQGTLKQFVKRVESLDKSLAKAGLQSYWTFVVLSERESEEGDLGRKPRLLKHDIEGHVRSEGMTFEEVELVETLQKLNAILAKWRYNW